jgi:hypothetical protein
MVMLMGEQRNTWGCAFLSFFVFPTCEGGATKKREAVFLACPQERYSVSKHHTRPGILLPNLFAC